MCLFQHYFDGDSPTTSIHIISEELDLSLEKVKVGTLGMVLACFMWKNESNVMGMLNYEGSQKKFTHGKKTGKKF